MGLRTMRVCNDGAYEKAFPLWDFIDFKIVNGVLTSFVKYQIFMYDDKLFKSVGGTLKRMTDAEQEYWNNLPESEKNWSA